MIWEQSFKERKQEIAPTPALPNEGDTRTVRRYAWLPTKLSDGRTILFEHYLATERFQYAYRVTRVEDGPFLAYYDVIREYVLGWDVIKKVRP